MLSQEKVSDDVEEITKTPVHKSVRESEQETKVKEKDPKKVAAGKKLAEYNKRAKEALKEKMKREAEGFFHEKVPERETGEPKGWIPELSFTTAISLVGIGLTAINMFMSHRTPSEPPQVRLPESNRVEPPTSKIPIPITPKIGMS